MLYFIKSQNYLKIGYTKDKSTYFKRINDYKTHNPEFKVLDVVKDGTSKDEINLHHLLVKYSYYTEWFHNCSEVYTIWNKYTKGMERFDPDKDEEKIIKKLQKETINNNKMEKIQEDVDKVFSKGCIMTGEEIKDTLRDIYSYHGFKTTYIEIKNLKKFGYSLSRFLDGNKFKYRIKKIMC